MGNFLIKRVAETLKNEFPNLKTFVTLSPIPGFIDWINQGANVDQDDLKPAVIEKLQANLAHLDLKNKSWNERLNAGWKPEIANQKDQEALMSLCAIYLMYQSSKRGGNPVAKFHLGNGAKLHRINWAGDLSKKGLRQSAGAMVNYLYDLNDVEENHEKFINGEVTYSRAVSKLI